MIGFLDFLEFEILGFFGIFGIFGILEFVVVFFFCGDFFLIFF